MRKDGLGTVGIYRLCEYNGSSYSKSVSISRLIAPGLILLISTIFDILVIVSSVGESQETMLPNGSSRISDGTHGDESGFNLHWLLVVVSTNSGFLVLTLSCPFCIVS